MTMATTAAGLAVPTASGNRVSLFQLYALRATYLLLVVGLGPQIWPQIIDHPLSMHRVTSSMLGAVAALAMLGLRYPLKMLPLLFFELVWKATWLLAVALPLWRAHQIDPDTMATIQACLMGVIFPIVIPWRYVFAKYAMGVGDRWR